MPSPSLPATHPSAHTNTHRTKRPIPIKKHKVIAAMSARCTANSLEPFLGTYRIVWDSESNYDPRDVLFDAARPERDPDDGLLTLARPQRAPAWPKEPAPASNVVLRLRDAFLGTDRTASVLKLSPRATPGPAVALDACMLSSSSSAPPSPLQSAAPSPSPSASSSSRRPSPIYIPSSASASPQPEVATGKGARRFWRFDWDPSFPRLGFRFEGMDLTAPRGHALSFARIRDDRGAPFAVLDLRVTRRRRSGKDTLGDEAGEEGEGEGGEAKYITVVAKRVEDRYAREGLSDAERARLGMVELDELDAGMLFDSTR